MVNYSIGSAGGLYLTAQQLKLCRQRKVFKRFVNSSSLGATVGYPFGECQIYMFSQSLVTFSEHYIIIIPTEPLEGFYRYEVDNNF